jgi:RNA polymerase sigma-70 factor (ECF subfamily)
VNELERHLWRLSPLLREALVLIGAQEMTYAEAAMVCGVGIGTMKARVSRARATLRALLEETGERQDKTFTE